MLNSAATQRRWANPSRRLAPGLVAALALAWPLAAWGAEPEQPAAPVGGRPDGAKIYQPVGAPADPKVPAQWNRYHDYADATRLLEQLAAAHPEVCRLQSLGKSYGGREMWLLTMTDFATGPADKSAFWIDGAIHANEIQATEVVLYTAWYLAETFGRGELATKLLRERTFYLVPMMSPDSRDAHMYRANSTNSPRSGQRPVDDDRDGLVDEDGPDDLDGDGHITQMRIRDPFGRYKPHPDYPNMLIEAKPDERGEYTLLGTEGYDNDGDGLVNEDGDGFYDPNRNWGWGWQPEPVQGGAHQYPFSIVENRLVADFVRAHPNIAGAQSYHNAGGMILRGPGVKTDRLEPADLAVYNELGRTGERMLPGYRYLEVGTQLYEAMGSELDWFYNMRGAFIFTNELFTAANFFHQPADGGGFFGKAEDQRLFDKYLLLGEGTVPWHEVDHPQYGKIEVGGLKKNWVRQPPSFLLEEECHRNMAFTLYHADQMPQVDIERVDVCPLEGDLWQIDAVVVNRRLLPSRAAVDVRYKLSPPDRLTLSGEQVRVHAGLVATRPTFDEPSEQKRRPAQMRIESIPGMGAVYVRWYASGAGPIAVSLQSTKGGSATRAVVLVRPR